MISTETGEGGVAEQSSCGRAGSGQGVRGAGGGRTARAVVGGWRRQGGLASETAL